MTKDQNFQIYNPDLTYIEGWYSIEKLEIILNTMKRIKAVNENFAPNKDLQENNTQD